MIPIAEQDWSNVNIIRCLSWTVDDHRSCETGRVLCTVMGVIPRCTVKVCKEGIGHARSRSDRALINSRNAIVPRSSLLQKPMPMKRSTFFGARDLVTNVDGDSIAPIGFDGRTGECTIDKQSASIHSIRRNYTTGDIEVVRGTIATCKDGQCTSQMSSCATLLTTVKV